LIQSLSDEIDAPFNTASQCAKVKIETLTYIKETSILHLTVAGHKKGFTFKQKFNIRTP